MTPIDPSALNDHLASLPGWTLDAEQRAISRSFRFKDFAQAFGFMAEVALKADAARAIETIDQERRAIEERLADAETIAARIASELTQAEACEPIYVRLVYTPAA